MLDFFTLFLLVVLDCDLLWELDISFHLIVLAKKLSLAVG